MFLRGRYIHIIFISPGSWSQSFACVLCLFSSNFLMDSTRGWKRSKNLSTGSYLQQETSKDRVLPRRQVINRFLPPWRDWRQKPIIHSTWAAKTLGSLFHQWKYLKEML